MGTAFNPQSSTFLSNLPTELLEPIVANLDTPSILALRSSCQIASHLVDKPFRALLSSRKYFIHPYSLQLLTQLSQSPLSSCVNRIVLGTETFGATFSLKTTEYASVLSSAFQRFKNLKAVEIRDFSTPYPSHSSITNPWAVTPGPLDPITDDQPPRPSRFDTLNAPYHLRWGSEPDQLRSQGIHKVAEENGVLPRALPPTPPHGPEPSILLGELFRAVWTACTAAQSAGVKVTDLQVALVNINWGLRDIDFWGVTSSMMEFLSSLEVLHVAILNGRGMRSEDMTHIKPFLSACHNLKWLRLEFQETGAGPVWQIVHWLGTELPNLKLDRLDLGSMVVHSQSLVRLVERLEPKVLGAWDVVIEADEVSGNPWADALRQLPPLEVKLANVGQEVAGVWEQIHFLPERGRILDLTSTEDGLDEFEQAVVLYDLDYSNWE